MDFKNFFYLAESQGVQKLTGNMYSVHYASPEGRQFQFIFSVQPDNKIHINWVTSSNKKIAKGRMIDVASQYAKDLCVLSQQLGIRIQGFTWKSLEGNLDDITQEDPHGKAKRDGKFEELAAELMRCLAGCQVQQTASTPKPTLVSPQPARKTTSILDLFKDKNDPMTKLFRK